METWSLELFSTSAFALKAIFFLSCIFTKDYGKYTKITEIESLNLRGSIIQNTEIWINPIQINLFALTVKE